jgi:hypothetical protein
MRRGDDQDFIDPCQHQNGQRIIDHGLVVDRQQLLADGAGHRIEPGAQTSGQDDALVEVTVGHVAIP